MAKIEPRKDLSYKRKIGPTVGRITRGQKGAQEYKSFKKMLLESMKKKAEDNILKATVIGASVGAPVGVSNTLKSIRRQIEIDTNNMASQMGVSDKKIKDVIKKGIKEEYAKRKLSIAKTLGKGALKGSAFGAGSGLAFGLIENIIRKIVSKAKDSKIDA